MKVKLIRVVTVCFLFLVAFAFLALIYSKGRNVNSFAYVIDNNNLSKRDDNTSLLFEEKEVKEEKEEIVPSEAEEEKEENTEKKETVVEELAPTSVVTEKKQEETKQVEAEVKEEKVEQPKVEPQKEEKVETNVTSLQEVREVIKTDIGNLTGYGPDCYGCSGRTSSGHNLYDSIYYEDSEFGTVRILAADPSFPMYSIIRVSNVPNMDDFIGIVLDRGGNVGYGRGTLFDLAFESESSPSLISLTRNVKFELLRSGR